MSSSAVVPQGLHFVATSPRPGLAVAEKRVKNPLATLICIHGGLDRGGSFARLARRVEKFDVLAYDRRGYQASRDLGPLGFDHHVEDLKVLIASERERGPVILFGHSYGGLIAFAAAADPSLTVGLTVAYESPFHWVHSRDSSHSIHADDPAAEAERFFRRMVSNSAWDRLSELERQSRRLDGPALVDDLQSIRRGTATVDLAAIHSPCAYLFGDGMLRDYYATLAEKLVERVPSMTIREFTQAPHGAHLAIPDQIADCLDNLWEHACASA